MHSCDRLAGSCLLLKPQFSRGQRGTQALKIHIFQQVFTEHLPRIRQILFLHSSPCPCKTYILVAERQTMCRDREIRYKCGVREGLTEKGATEASGGGVS